MVWVAFVLCFCGFVVWGTVRVACVVGCCVCVVVGIVFVVCCVASGFVFGVAFAVAVGIFCVCVLDSCLGCVLVYMWGCLWCCK